MIEIQELNVIRRGPHWQLEVVVDFDAIPGIPETIRVPVPVDWTNFDIDEVMQEIEERVKRATSVLRTEIMPALEQFKSALKKKGKKIE